MKSIAVAFGCAFTCISLLGQSVANRQLNTKSEMQRAIGNLPGPQQPLARQPDSQQQHRVGVVSDWSQRHVVFSPSNNKAVVTRLQQDPRWLQSWFLHHRQVWWGGPARRRLKSAVPIQRDWNVSLGAVTFGPILDSGNVAPGGGETFPAKYTWDVTQNPDCTRDYIAMGLPVTPASGGQANIVGFNNLYSNASNTGFCTGTGPNALFAYASGTGEVPASLSMSLDGTKLSYVEDILSGSSYLHVLTIGTTGNNGTSPTAAAVPGVGNNASDVRVLLSPDGGVTNQSSTSAPFIDYQNDAAYVTTYSWITGTGYLYRISPVFNGTPAITWSLVIACAGSQSSVPSGPVYDGVSDKVFLMDTGQRIDRVTNPEGTPTLVCGSAVGFFNSTANTPVVDSTNEVVYYTLNIPGLQEWALQQDTSGGTGTNHVIVGDASAAFTSPYDVDFDNDYYSNCDVYQNGVGGGTCPGNPLLYTAGTDGTNGTIPTLYAASFTVASLAPDITNNQTPVSTALATGAADSSPVTEYFNATTAKDYLFVGVTDNCAATTLGGIHGCVMSLDITAGPPTVSATTTALAAPGGPTGMVIDNDSSDPEASSIYYANKGDGHLVKATQAGLN